MNLTDRGKRVAAGLLLLLGAGALFVDPLLLAAAASVSVFVVYDLLDGYLTPRRAGSFALQPSAFEARALRGNSRSFVSVLRASRGVTLDLGSVGWFRAERGSYPAGTWPFRFTLTFDLAGAYSLDGIPARASSRYGLFSSRAVIPAEVKGRAYPRLIAAAVAALEYLTRVGAGAEGEVEKETIGAGLEYAETREYSSGDSLRRVDWKATARSGSSSLMIKKYYSEGGGAVHVIYFVETPGRATHDELATQLLDLVVSSAARITPISVTAYEGGSRLTTLQGKGWEVVINTLNLVMAESRITYDDLYSMLDVSSLSRERRELILAGKGRFAELLGRAGGKRQALVSDFRSLVASLASPDVQSSFIILSSLVSNRDVLAEIIEDLRFRRVETTLVYPPKPWKDASSLAEAYTLQSSHEKMLDYAARTGCLMGVIPLKLPRVKGIPSWAVSAAA
ncbi:MAG: DUF58 domain-containing protein [Nitrososphaerota archaeon]|jgi:hypothetical protein|nr:DUF58 domain-containing protein [Nitrososphaerota archaeon]MDG6956848.1 DUF58 domain-containing protein [Nitrososphaerota archaeon]MDG6987234.1 DUF58 domain-containing protein [Nitrososphaerota archaeon]MDG7014878.1 DUF58 domain-containing protein [Nitrososphaerota archaeon]WGO50839.1 MAG: DUF58 domain-containing protein [Nitrososphaerota archaeon]